MLCTLTLFTSCDKDTDDEVYQYRYGLTSSINDQYEEIETIERAYCDAYKNAGLKFVAYPNANSRTRLRDYSFKTIRILALNLLIWFNILMNRWNYIINILI